MQRYMTDRGRPSLVALYDIRPGNGAGQFLQPRSPHGAQHGVTWRINTKILSTCRGGGISWRPSAYSLFYYYISITNTKITF